MAKKIEKFSRGLADEKSYKRRNIYFKLIKSCDSAADMYKIVKRFEKEEIMFKIDFLKVFLHHYKVREHLENIEEDADVDSGVYVEVCKGLKYVHEFQDVFCKGAPLSEVRV